MQDINIYLDEINFENKKLITQRKIRYENKRTETYEPNFEYENYEEEMIKGESVLDCMLENTTRDRAVLKKFHELLIKIKFFQNTLIKTLKFELEIDKDDISNVEKVIENLIKINKKQEEKELIEPNNEIKELKNNFENFKNKFQNYKIPVKPKRKFISTETLKSEFNLERKEMIQLENWTKKRIDNILFDSNINDWNKNNSLFFNKIYGKSNFVILIEDTKGNKFGGYFNSKVNSIKSYNSYDLNAFVFNLKSNGRLTEMMKFEITNPNKSFRIYSSSSNWLFSIGSDGGNNGLDDITVMKRNYENGRNGCCQRCYNYKGIQNALCGSKEFDIQRFVIIQMN